VPVGIVLAQSALRDDPRADEIRRTLIETASRFRPHGGTETLTHLVVPGRSQASVLPLRMRSRDPRVQMPPLGTALPDEQAVALIERWIDQDLNHNETTQEENRSWTAATKPLANPAATSDATARHVSSTGRRLP
jgi:hypothetical protein